MVDLFVPIREGSCMEKGHKSNRNRRSKEYKRAKATAFKSALRVLDETPESEPPQTQPSGESLPSPRKLFGLFIWGTKAYDIWDPSKAPEWNPPEQGASKSKP